MSTSSAMKSFCYISVLLLQEESVDGVLGHQFVQRRMHKPTSCSACEEIIWQDGIACLSKSLSGQCQHVYV